MQMRANSAKSVLVDAGAVDSLARKQLCTALQKMGDQDNRKGFYAQSARSRPRQPEQNATSKRLPQYLVAPFLSVDLGTLAYPKISHRCELVARVEQWQAVTLPGR